jgi:hypothetical protein
MWKRLTVPFTPCAVYVEAVASIYDYGALFESASTTSSSRTTPPAGLAMTAALETFELPRQTVDSVGDVRVRTTLLRTDCGPKGLRAQDRDTHDHKRAHLRAHRQGGGVFEAQPVPAATRKAGNGLGRAILSALARYLCGT